MISYQGVSTLKMCEGSLAHDFWWLPQVKTQLIEYDYIKMEEDLDEEPQGTEATTSHESQSDHEEATAQPPAIQEAPTAVLSDHHDERPLQNEISNEDGFTREAIDAGYMFVEAIHDVAEEELSAGWGWFGASNSEDPVAATTTKLEKRRRKKQRKRRSKKGKKKRVRKTSPGVGGHVEWTHIFVKLNSVSSIIVVNTYWLPFLQKCLPPPYSLLFTCCIW